MKHLVFLVILFSIFSCQNQPQTKLEDTEFKNETLLKNIKDSSTLTVLNKLSKNNFLGKPLKNVLDSLSQTNYKIQNIYWSDTNNLQYRQVSLIDTLGNYQLKLGFINGPQRNILSANTGNADSLLNCQIDIIQLIKRTPSTKGEKAIFINGKQVKTTKEVKFKNQLFPRNFTVDLASKTEVENTILYLEKNVW